MYACLQGVYTPHPHTQYCTTPMPIRMYTLSIHHNTHSTWTCLVVLTSEVLETPPIKHKPPRCPWLLTLFTAEHIRNTVNVKLTSCPGVVCGVHVNTTTATHTNNKKQTKKQPSRTINRSVTENMCCQERRHTLKVHWHRMGGREAKSVDNHH